MVHLGYCTCMCNAGITSTKKIQNKLILSHCRIYVYRCMVIIVSRLTSL